MNLPSPLYPQQSSLSSIVSFHSIYHIYLFCVVLFFFNISTDVYAVVQPIDVGGGEKEYKIGFVSKSGVPPFGPLLPEHNLFKLDETFRKILISYSFFALSSIEWRTSSMHSSRVQQEIDTYKKSTSYRNLSTILQTN
jgi:hypothetical protein